MLSSKILKKIALLLLLLTGIVYWYYFKKNDALIIYPEGQLYITPGESLEFKTKFVDPAFIDISVLNEKGDEQAVTISRSGHIYGNIKIIPSANFNAGVYTVIAKDLSTNQEQRLKFEYGVLVLNVDKSSYKAGESAFIQIASLDSSGHTVCDANLELEIYQPDNNVTRLTINNGISISDSCGADNLTDAPDYFATINDLKEGNYELVLTNITNGKKVVKNIEVGSNNQFVVTRTGATRINPFKGTSSMSIKLSCSDLTWEGYLIERVPTSFVINQDNRNVYIESDNNSKLLIFPANCSDRSEFTYTYLAPKKSPEIFYLGNIQILDINKNILWSDDKIWALASDAVGDGIAILSGTQTTNSTNINDITAYPVQWSNYDYDSRYFSITSVDNTKLTITQDGDVFVAISVPMEGSVARSSVKAEVYVNGVPYDGSIGESSYIRNISNHNESSDNMALILTGLNAGDYIQLYVNGDAASGNVTVGTAISMTAEFISRSNAPVYNIFSATAVQTTSSTNLNGATAYPLVWNHTSIGTAYNHDNATNAEQISFNDAGLYWVNINIPLEGTVARANVRLKVLLNGLKVIGGEGKQGYIRNLSGHTKSSIHWSGIVQANSGDILTITTEQEAASGIVTVQTNKKASLSIQQLPTNNILVSYASSTTAGTNINPLSATNWAWSNDLVIDSSVFTHSTSINNDEITVLEDGDYLLSFNSTSYSTTSRTNNKIKVLVNGVAINGAESKSGYIRNSSGHNESSMTLVYLLKALSAGDIITVSTEQEAASGTVTTTDDSILMIWYKPLTISLLEQNHYHWRNDDNDLASATSATGGNEDTPLFDVNKGSVYRLRLGVSNRGTIISDPVQFQLEYGEKNGSCEAVTSWNAVGSGNAFDMFDSSYFIDGDDTTNISVVNGGVFDEETIFIPNNNGAKDTSDTVATLTLDRHEFVELEYSIQVTNNAKAGSTYCFRVSNNGNPIDSYQQYAEMTILSNNDFKIQRGTFILTGTSHTLTAGIDYKAPSAIDKAFIRITNTSATGAGKDFGGGAQNNDDVTVYIQNPDNLLTSVDFVRASSGSNNTFIAWEIIEYTGPSNGPNEIVVRDQGTITFGTSSLIEYTSTINNIVDDNDVVVWVTGVQNPDTGRSDYNTGLITSNWDYVNDQGIFERGEAGGDAVNISWAVVEFVGEHWSIQRISHTYSSAGTVEAENIPKPINDLSRAFLYTQKLSGTGLQGLDEYGHEVWISAVDTISFLIQSGASTPSGQTSVAWVIENTQTNGVPMRVWRSNGSLPTGTTEPHTTIVNIGTTLRDISNASIFVNNRSSGSGTYYPRAIVGAYISDLSHYSLWQSDTGQTETFRTEIVEWPIATPELEQRDFRIYHNTDSLNVNSAWARQNGVAEAIPLGEAFRIRSLYNVGLKDMEVDSVKLKIQVAKAVGDCDPSFTGEVYQDVGPTGFFDYYDNLSLSNGSNINTTLIDPVDGSIVIHPQTYSEISPLQPSQTLTPIGEDAMWDISLISNTAQGGTRYCFRTVFDDGTLLKNYSKIWEVFTGPTNNQMLRHGGVLDTYNTKKVLTY